MSSKKPTTNKEWNQGEKQRRITASSRQSKHQDNARMVAKLTNSRRQQTRNC
jgi:hypothetical protein